MTGRESQTPTGGPRDSGRRPPARARGARATAAAAAEDPGLMARQSGKGLIDRDDGSCDYFTRVRTKDSLLGLILSFVSGKFVVM